MNKLWLVGSLAIACGGRPAGLNAPFTPGTPIGLDRAAAVLDPALDRVLLVSSPGPLALKVEPMPVGHDVTTMRASPDGQRLFVLSRGVSPRRHPEDERPRLTLIDTEPSPHVTRRYELDDPLSGLVLDEHNEWAVLYVTPDDSRPVSNPNEILLVDLVHLEREPIPMTVLSTSGSPQRFLFTDPLSVPNGEPRRLLVAAMQNEVTLIDLAEAVADETRGRAQIAIPMPENQAGVEGQPAEVVFHDRDDERGVDAELAVRLAQDTNVLLLPLAAPGADSERAFRVEPNLVDVGGVPATVHFVNTDDGVRLAALVGRDAVLVDPATSNALHVGLSTPFTGMRLVTEALGGATRGTDIALLWGASVPTVGLWNLGQATASARHGLETLEVGAAVANVLDVPGDEFATSKILESTNGDFYVLDLTERRSAPMLTNGRSFALTFAPGGGSRRLWAYAPSGWDFSSVDLGSLSPVSLSAEVPIWALFDLEQTGGGSGRTALVLHREGGELGATVLDALDPDDGNTRFFSGLELGGLIHD